MHVIAIAGEHVTKHRLHSHQQTIMEHQAWKSEQASLVRHACGYVHHVSQSQYIIAIPSYLQIKCVNKMSSTKEHNSW